MKIYQNQHLYEKAIIGLRNVFIILTFQKVFNFRILALTSNKKFFFYKSYLLQSLSNTLEKHNIPLII
jgi:hypothetical protein